MNSPRKLLELHIDTCHFLLYIGNCFYLLLECLQVEGNSTFIKYVTPAFCHANPKFSVQCLLGIEQYIFVKFNEKQG